MTTLRQIKQKAILANLVNNNFNQAVTAKELHISPCTVKNLVGYRREAIQKAYDLGLLDANTYSLLTA